MKKSQFFFAIAFAISATFISAKNATSQELWNGLSFGDSKDNVIKKFPNSKPNNYIDRNKNLSIDYLVIDGFGFEPCSLLVDFSFPYPFKNLTAVHVKTKASIINAPQATRTQCARQVLHDLIDKYGEPNQSGYAKNKGYKAAVWNREGGIFIEFTYIDVVGVNITYSKGNHDIIIPFKDMKSAL